ncbi:MAG: CHAP domain-containing protein [Nocardioides sp.]
MTLRRHLRAPLTTALCTAVALGLLTLAPAPAPAAAPRSAPSAERSLLDSQPSGVKGHRGPGAVFKRSSYLCYGYQDCRDKKMGNSGYEKNSRTMYWRMYSGHNCTNYAAYRMVRSGLPNERPWSGGGNATYWGTSMPRITDDVPRVRAIAWWRANVGPAGSAGHVAFVEEVVSKDEIVISQDSWGGDFSWARVTRGSGNWPSGFIHFNDKPLTNKSAPAVDGVAKVGSVLSSTTGKWKPTSVDVSYQWFADGNKIRGATNETFKLTKARLGQRVSVKTSAAKVGYPTRTATSAPTEAVLPGQLSSQTPPSLSGVAKVDSVLTLDTGTWSPTPGSLSIRWFADGQRIEGSGTGSTTLPLTPDLAGRAITASVTANRSGYDPVSADSAPSKAVAPGNFRITAPPSLSGDAAPDGTLGVEPGDFRPSDATIDYQWLRDGEPVLNATGPDYQISNVDLGSRIAARIILSRAGYTSTTVDSPATARIKTDPSFQLQVERLKHRVRVRVAVTAPGVETVSGPVAIRIAGQVEKLDLRADGTARATLKGMRPGERTLTVRYGGSRSVNKLVAVRTVRVR